MRAACGGRPTVSGWHSICNSARSLSSPCLLCQVEAQKERKRQAALERDRKKREEADRKRLEKQQAMVRKRSASHAKPLHPRWRWYRVSP